MADRPSPDGWLQIPVAEGRLRIEAAQDGRISPKGWKAERPGEGLSRVQRVIGALALGLFAAGVSILGVFVLLTLVFHFGPVS